MQVNLINLKKVLVAFYLLIGSTASMAALNHLDYLSAGDQLLIEDNRMGLEWLSLTVTANQSYDDVISPNSIFSQQGFRLATSVDMSEFLVSSGALPFVINWNDRSLDMIFSPPSFIYNSAHILLQEFGCLSCPFNIEGLNPMSQGYFDSSGFDHIQGLNFGTYQRFEGPNFDTLSNAGMLNYLKSIPGTIPDMGFSDSHPLTGAFLVRNIIPVPEPETYAMLMAGLGVMSFRFRRKVADIC